MSLYSGKIVRLRRANGDTYNMALVCEQTNPNNAILIKTWSNKRYADGGLTSIGSQTVMENLLVKTKAEKLGGGYEVVSENNVDSDAILIAQLWIVKVHNNTVKNTKDPTAVDWFAACESRASASERSQNPVTREKFASLILNVRMSTGLPHVSTSRASASSGPPPIPPVIPLPATWRLWA